jgi:DNA polymerase-3 subunit beta
MKFTVERDVLFSTLNTVLGAIERSQIPILANVLIRGGNNKLAFTTSNLDIEYVAEIAAEVDKPHALTVPAKMLREIVKKMPKASTIIGETDDSKDAILKLRCGRSGFKLNTLPVADFPEFSLGEFPHQFTIEADALARLFAGCQFAICTEETRYYLNGIYLHISGTGDDAVLRAVATDGHRLAQMQIKAPEGSVDMPGVIVPRRTVTEVIKLCNDHDAVETSLSDTKIIFEAGGVRLASRLIDGTFPDYGRVIPAGNDKILTVTRASMSHAVDRVATVSSERGRAVKLSMNPGSIGFDVSDPDAGSAHEELEVTYEAPPLQIGFNSKYLTDILDEIDTNDVEIRLADPGSPTLFLPKGNETSLYVLMPMRV